MRGVRTIVALPSKPMKIYELFKQYGVQMEAEKDVIIFREGEQANTLFLVESGIIQICKNAESGKEITLSLLGPESLVGESKLYCDELHHSSTAKVLQPAVLLCLHIATFESLLKEHSGALVDYLKWIQNENLKNQSRLRDLLMHGKKGALYSTLIRLSNTYGEVCHDGSILIQFPLTNTEMANLCATSREVVNRMLNDLKKNRIITFDKGYITILDLAYLKRCIACDNCPLEICRID